MDTKNVTKVKSSLVKIATTLVLFVAFFAFGGIKADAKVIQTAEGDGSATISWDDDTKSDYSIGYAKITDEPNGSSNASAAAKAMAEARTVVVPAGTKSYTIAGLENNSQYYVYVQYTYGSKTLTPGTSSNSYVYTAMTGVTGLNQEKWWKYIKKVDVTWDKIPGNVSYEVMFMNASGSKVIDSKTVTYNSYSHDINNNQIYTVKVRATRTPNSSFSTCPATSTEWTPVAYLFTQPTVTSLKVSGGKMNIKWGKIKGATSYTVYASTKKNGGYKKVGTVKGKKNSLTVKKLKGKKFKSSKKYYFYIVANKKVGGIKYTSGANYTYETKNGSFRETYSH